LEFFGLGRLGVTWSPIDDRWYGPITRRTTAGISVTEETAKNYSACWAATRILAGTGGSLPLNLYRPRFGGGKAIAANHAVHALLHDAPNPQMGSMQFRCLGLDRQINSGNFFAEIERDAIDRPQRLWPIHPSRIPRGAERTKEGDLLYEITNDDGSKSPIAAADMLHVPSILTKDGINGIGVVAAARESIGFGIGTERHGAAYFGNGTRPSAVLRHPRKIVDKEQRDELRRQWNEMHQGPYNAGKTALLQEGMEVTLLPISAEDAQFLQTRQHNVEEMARWYGVPPHLIGHLLRSTFNNIEVQSIEFVVYSLLPWLKLWEEESKRKLLSDEERAQGLYVKHVADALLRGDSKARAEFYKAMRELGVFSANDIAELEDRNPIGPEGDTRFVPANWINLEKAAESGETSGETSVESPEPEEEETPNLLRVIADRCGNLVAAQASLHTDLLEQFGERCAAVGCQRSAVSDQRDPEDPESRQPKADSRQPLAESRDALAAAYEVLDQIVQRMLSKEQNAARRAAARPASECFQWLDPFYEKHEQLLHQALRGPVRVIAVLEGRPEQAEHDALALARTHVEESRRDLLAAMECQPDQLAARVEQAIAPWKESRRIVFSGETADSRQPTAESRAT
jgi:HK97 family phage portal protein